MKNWILLPAAFVASLTTTLLVRRPADVAAPRLDAVEAAGTGPRLAAVQARQDAFDRALERLASRPRQDPADQAPLEVDDEELAAAVERWRAAHPGRASATAGAGAETRAVAADPGDLRGLSMEQFLQLLDDTEDQDRAQVLLNELRAAGRLDEFMELVEDLAAENPGSADVQMLRAVTYLQKIFEVGQGPEAGLWAMKADEAFDSVLEIDPANWEARFTKAVALSNWPPILGRQSEALEHFEVLIRQQEEGAPEPRFAQSYLFLGNMYQQLGQKEKALETWRRGLATFPTDAELRNQIDLAGD